MNRYPLWKNAIIVVVFLIGLIYSLPNLFGESPAVQVSSGKATVKVDTDTLAKVESALAAESLKPSLVQFDGNSVKARFETTDDQIRARDVLERTFNPDPAAPTHVVALNLLPRTPAWLASMGAAPMYLGLDLRGGVHFLLEVDMAAALQRRADVLATDLRTSLREKGIRHGGISRSGQSIEVRTGDASTFEAVRNAVLDSSKTFRWPRTPTPPADAWW